MVKQAYRFINILYIITNQTAMILDGICNLQYNEGYVYEIFPAVHSSDDIQPLIKSPNVLEMHCLQLVLGVNFQSN